MQAGVDPELAARVLVVGGGPAGLAIAACLKHEGVSYIQVDREGVFGGAYRKMFPATELLSPARYTQLPGLPIKASGAYVSAREYLDYLDRYAAHHRLQMVKATVKEIMPLDDSFQVHFQEVDQRQSYDIVVLATGIFAHPVVPAIAGLDIEHDDKPTVIHSRDWQGYEPFHGQRILIVGAGMSGVEIAEQCAGAGMRVTISSRKRVRLWRRRVFGIDVHHIAHLFSHRLPRWVAGSYCRKLPALGAFDRGFRRWVRSGQIRKQVEVRRFEGKQAEFADGSKESFDVAVLATGYRWHPPCLPEAVETGDAGHPIADGGMVRGVPGLFVIGAPCGRMLPSEFLHGVNHDAPAIAKTIAQQLSK